MTRVGIIGAGLMGTGLARLFGRAGWAVTVADTDPAALAALRDTVPAAATGDLAAAVGGATLVIEAAAERVEVKAAIFADLVACGGDAILATNSSVIAVGAITAGLNDTAAARCVGLHFWNPPDLIPLVEVIAGPRTAVATVDAAMALLRAAGKEPVHVRRDCVPGNRLQHALWREAMALVEEGVCTAADVDTIVKRSFGLRLAVLGPLENADLVGLGLTREIHAVVLPTLSRATAPSPGLDACLAAGRAGVAAGAGFHDGWTPASVAAMRARLAAHLATMPEPAQ